MSKELKLQRKQVQLEEKITANKRIKKVKKEHTDISKEEIQAFTQDFMPIVNIQDGIIETKDGRFIKIIEIDPINFNLRSYSEKIDIIQNFASILKLSTLVTFQLKAVTKQADPRRYIDILTKKLDKEQNEKTKELSKHYLKLIKELGSSQALTRRFFMVFQYNPNSVLGERRLKYMDIVNELNGMQMALASYFSACGNTVVNAGQDDTYHILEILYMLYNRRTSLSEVMDKRYDRLSKDYAQVNKEKEVPLDIPVQDLLAPRGLDFSKYDHVVSDGLYYTYLYIDKNGYPDGINLGWASMLTGMGNGIDVDIHVRKEDKSRILESIARRFTLNRSKINNMKSVSRDFEEVRDALTSAGYLKSMIQGGQDFFYFSILITISAPTYKSLMDKKDRIKRDLRTQDIIANELPFQMRQAYESTSLINKIDKNIFNKSKHNAPTDNLAALAYFFTAYEIGDDNGVLLGVNKANSSLCVLDLFNAHVYKNANMVIIGTSGSGKTFTMSLMALRMRMSNVQVFIIAPLKGHEFMRSAQAIGGTYAELSMDSSDNINIFEIRKPDTSSLDILNDSSSMDTGSLLNAKLEQLMIFYRLIITEMSQEQEALLKQASLQAYHDKGITDENDSIFVHGTKELKVMPILEDVYEILKTYGDVMLPIVRILGQFVMSKTKGINQQTNVDLNNKYVVLSISKFPEHLQAAGMFIALDYCWDKIKQDPTQKKAIFIDETWKLINSNPIAANYVLEIFKVIRGYGGSAVAATQDLNDFFALENGKYGKGIINNSKTKIILNLEREELKGLMEPFNLSRLEANKIVNADKGDALLVTNNNKVPVNIRASQREFDLITTDALALSKQVEQKKLTHSREMTKEEIIKDIFNK